MSSVTQRIGKIKQPYGGYINKKSFNVVQLEDNITLNDNENISPGLIGLAVDYMTRFMMGTKKEEAFFISLKGAFLLDIYTSDKKGTSIKNAKKLLKNIKGLDKKSIINACKLVGYDGCYRSGLIAYKPVKEITPNKETIENITIMIQRSLSFWEIYGPITKDGFNFEGGYTDIISAGDGDYLSEDTLWDFKVSKDEPRTRYTLQILVYYIMGMHSIHEEFKSIRKLGIYNPRLNKVYLIGIDKIPSEIIEEVSKNVIGY